MNDYISLYYMPMHMCLALCSYFAEYTDRYSYYKNLHTLNEKEQWRTLLDNLPLGILVIRQGKIQFGNVECRQNFGLGHGLSKRSLPQCEI